MLRKALIGLATWVALLAIPAGAQAKDCTAKKPFVRAGTYWVVYTFSEPGRAEVSCTKARRMTANAMRGRAVSGWKCSQKRQRCVRGGTYVDEYGFSQWRHIVGWHIAD